jgi:cytochrome c oxidase assembly protein subunit 15
MPTDVPLVDLSPLLPLAGLALVAALLPLAWVWLRRRGTDTRARLAALTAVTLFLTFDLIVFGAFTRLSDSGLGCPDWPGCYGEASPLGAKAEIAAWRRILDPMLAPHMAGIASVSVYEGEKSWIYTDVHLK